MASTYAYIYGCWQETALGANYNKGWDEFFVDFAKSRGLKDYHQLKRAHKRIIVYFWKALKRWRKNPYSPDPIAYLLATEEFWFDDSVQIAEDVKLPNPCDPARGIDDFYPRATDEQGGSSAAHVQRSNAIWQTLTKKANGRCPGVHTNMTSATRSPTVDDWTLCFSPRSQPQTISLRDGLETFSLSPDISASTLWQVANELQEEDKFAWDDEEMTFSFDFDRAIKGGLCEEEEAAENIQSPNMNVKALPPSPVKISTLDAKLPIMHLEEVQIKMQKKQHQMRNNSVSGPQLPQADFTCRLVS
jgi:hypothetical protein